MHRIVADPKEKAIRRGHLAMGGQSPSGDAIAVNSYYVELSGKPFIPITGEFQFSRYPRRFWREELLKVAAGGVNTISTYIFWIHHEETQGSFDWSGSRDLGKFVDLCAQFGLYVLLRPGPFVHGECRNGGLPDWLYGQPFEVRSNDPAYLVHVQRYFEGVAAQVDGHLFKDGGPIIGVQVENEYMHAGAPWGTVSPERGLEWLPAGRDGADHIVLLKQMLVDVGIDVPIFTCTAWGSPIPGNDILPMSGGYAYPAWVDEPEPSGLFVFRDLHSAHSGAALGYQRDLYPSANAEMQGGMQVRYHNRPVVVPRSTEALALVRLAGGSNWLGYYVFHGGSHPVGKSGYTHERLHPRISYDYQAPISEFGLIQPAYRYLKRIHLFVRAWGHELAPMKVALPPGVAEIRPSDTASLRFCMRHTGGRGFLFVNNFQDHAAMAEHSEVKFVLSLPGEELVLPRGRGLTLRRDVCAIFPFNQSLEGVLLKYATAQMLTKVEHDGAVHYFFFAPQGIEAAYCFDAASVGRIAGEHEAIETEGGQAFVKAAVGVGSTLYLESNAGRMIAITTLTAGESKGCFEGRAWGRSRVIVSSGDLVFDGGGVSLYALGDARVDCWVFPRLEQGEAAVPAGCRVETCERYTHLTWSPPTWEARLKAEDKGHDKVLIRFEDTFFEGVEDVFLHVDYKGDMAEAYIDGQLVHDHFNNGLGWVLGLKRFWPSVEEHGLVLLFYPLQKGQVVNRSDAMAARLEFAGESSLEVRGIEAVAQHRLDIPAAGIGNGETPPNGGP